MPCVLNNKDILRLKVSMNYALAMKEDYALEYLDKKPIAYIHWEIVLGNKLVEATVVVELHNSNIRLATIVAKGVPRLVARNVLMQPNISAPSEHNVCQ